MYGKQSGEFVCGYWGLKGREVFINEISTSDLCVSNTDYPDQLCSLFDNTLNALYLIIMLLLYVRELLFDQEVHG